MDEEELAKHAGMAYEFSPSIVVVPFEYAIAAIKAEREACAKTCFDRSIDEPGKLPTPESYKEEAMLCAAYIRSRNNKTS